MQGLWEKFCQDFPNSESYLKDNLFFDDGSDTPNIEKIIDNVDIAHLDLARKGDDAIARELKGHRANLLRSVVRAAILNEQLLREPSLGVDTDELSDHRRLLSRLTANRQPGQAAPWVFTLNYDLAIEWAAEAIDLNVINGFGGIHARRFSPSNFELGFRNVTTQGEAQFGAYNIYMSKLHGSLSWRVNNDQTVSEVQIATQWPSIKEFLDGDDEKAPGVLIYPGSAKFIESTGFIYGEMIRRLTEFLSRSNSCLIISGYSFNDFHINRVLISALQNPTLQIVAYLPEIQQFSVDSSNGNLTVTSNSTSQTAISLIARKLPQVTVCGGNDRAYFNQMTLDLPQPALVDEQAKRSRELMKLLVETAQEPPEAASEDQQP